eukprot:m.313919 g.313919  ORF g.313919 m.313919 type:complete len:455 (+) comp20262_c0_seq3:364-1728(+)
MDSTPTSGNSRVPSLLMLGAGGFIGVHLTKRCAEIGYRITAVDIYKDKFDTILSEEARSNIKYVHLDIRGASEKKSMDDMVQAHDIVIDLIAFANPALYVTNPLTVFELNFTENMAIVQMCAKHNTRLIQFSTCEVYGTTAGSAMRRVETAASGIAGPTDVVPGLEPFSEDASPMIMGPVCAHRWIYASAKQLLERVLHAYGIERGFNYTIIRPFNFTGPEIDYLPSEAGGGNPRVFSHFINALLYGTPMKLVDGGRNYRGYTYIADAVEAIVKIVENKDGCCDRQIFNIGAPENECTIRELAFRMRDMFDKEFRVVSDPPSPEIVSVTSSEFYGEGYEDCDRRIADISKIRAVLGWEPTSTMDDVIRQTMKYFVEKHRRMETEAPAHAGAHTVHISSAAHHEGNVPPFERGLIMSSHGTVYNTSDVLPTPTGASKIACGAHLDTPPVTPPKTQ